MNEHDFISLPLEVLINIFTYLKLSDILNLMVTSKTMKNIILNQNILWRLLSKQQFIIIKKSEHNQISWYNRCRIFHNWCKGVYNVKVIVQHRINFMPWLCFINSEKLYLSVGSELQCYKLNTRGIPNSKMSWSVQVPIERRPGVRTNDISRFIVKDNKIVCGNRDGCVTVYEMHDNGNYPYLYAFIKDCHRNGLEEVSAVEKIGNTAISVSNKHDVVCFWQFNDTLEHPPPYVCRENQYRLPNQICCRSVAANKAENMLALGPTGMDRPLIFDCNVGSLSTTAPPANYAKEVRDIQWLNEQSVAFVTYCGKVQVFDIRSSGITYQSRDPFYSSIYCLKTDNHNTIVTGSSEYARCVLYDIRSKSHRQMYFTQRKSSPIYCLDFDTTKLIAAADRGVATLNFDTNKSAAHWRDYSDSFEVVNGPL